MKSFTNFSFHLVILAIGSKIMSSESVPEIPKKLINLVSNFGNQGLEYSDVRRRTLKSLFNGGIPVTLFDKGDFLKIPGTDEFVRATNFESVSLKLSVKGSPGENPDFNTLFRKELEYVKNLKPDANEASLRGLFWDSVISGLFFINCASTTSNFDLCLEWRTWPLFPKIGARIIDYVALNEVGGKTYPILQMEIGTGNFDSARHPHKDFSKMLGTMSLTCIELAHALAQNGK